MEKLFKVFLDGIYCSEDTIDPMICEDKQTAFKYIIDTFKNDDSWQVDNASIFQCQFENGLLVDKQQIAEFSHEDLDRLVNEKYYQICDSIENKKYDFTVEDVSGFSNQELTNICQRLKHDIWDIKDINDKIRLLTLSEELENCLESRIMPENQPLLSDELEEAI